MSTLSEYGSGLSNYCRVCPEADSYKDMSQ